MDFFVFVCAALMVLVGALGVIVRPNPVHAALSLVLTLFGIAVLFVMQDAQFLAAVQVIVYAGAIVVLFLFVIMLLGVDRTENLRTDPIAVQRWLAAIVGVGLLGLLGAAIAVTSGTIATRGTGLDVADEPIAGDAAGAVGDHDANLRQLAHSVFGDYVLAFELTSVLLVVAVVGTVVLARRSSRGGATVVDPERVS
jgi:NADH-quinone oxidoreductase subunit J